MAKTDVVGELPAEVSVQIFKYLSGEDLAQCSTVCQKWRGLTNNNALWKRVCLIEGIPTDGPVPPPRGNVGGLEPACEFKRLYTSHGSLLQKWRDNKYKTLDLQNIIGTAYFENGTVLSVMYWDGCIEVYDLSGTPEIIQSLPPIVPGGLLTFTIRNEEFVIFRCNRVFICYKWFEGMLHFWKALYALENNEGNVEIRTTRNIDFMHYLTVHKDTFWDIKAMIGDIVAFYVRQELTIYFWSLEESRCTDILTGVKNPTCKVYEKNLFICNLDEISVYNKRGERKLFLGLERLGYNIRHIDLHCNEYVILGVLNCSQGISFLKVWDWRWRNIIQIQEKLHGLVLHPKLPVVIYLSQYGSQRCKCRIVMRDLRNKNILWDTPFPTSQPFGTIYEDFVFFSIIKENYLLCVPRYDSSVTSNELLLYNVKTGKQIYHVKNHDNFIVNYSNDKLIEVILYNYHRVYVATRFMLYN